MPPKNNTHEDGSKLTAKTLVPIGLVATVLIVIISTVMWLTGQFSSVVTEIETLNHSVGMRIQSIENTIDSDKRVNWDFDDQLNFSHLRFFDRRRPAADEFSLVELAIVKLLNELSGLLAKHAVFVRQLGRPRTENHPSAGEADDDGDERDDEDAEFVHGGAGRLIL